MFRGLEAGCYVNHQHASGPETDQHWRAQGKILTATRQAAAVRIQALDPLNLRIIHFLNAADWMGLAVLACDMSPATIAEMKGCNDALQAG